MPLTHYDKQSAQATLVEKLNDGYLIGLVLIILGMNLRKKNEIVP